MSRCTLARKLNAVRASHPDRIVTWIPALLLSPLGGGMTASARQRSWRSATFAEAQLLVRDLAITNFATAAVASNLILFRRAGPRRRPQRPGNQSRKRVSGNPPVTHPRESPAAAGSTAIIRQVQKSSRFRWNHSLSDRLCPQYKTITPL